MKASNDFEQAVISEQVTAWAADRGNLNHLPGDADDVPALMVRLMRQISLAKTKAGAMYSEDTVPTCLLAKIGDGSPRRSGELAAEMDADPSTVSRQVAQLVKDGLVIRQADPRDGRACSLALTSAGRQRRNEVLQHRVEVFDSMTIDWTDDERSQFAELLRRYVQRLESCRHLTDPHSTNSHSTNSHSTNSHSTNPHSTHDPKGSHGSLN